MKKSLENYNNIRLSKRVKSNEDKTVTVSPPKNKSPSSVNDTSSFIENQGKKLIFKTKVAPPAIDKATLQPPAKTAATHAKSNAARSKFKLKRSMSEDDDDDDEEIHLANDAAEAKVEAILSKTKIKLKCGADSDSDSELSHKPHKKSHDETKKESPPSVNSKKNAKKPSPGTQKVSSACFFVDDLSKSLTVNQKERETNTIRRNCMVR